MENIKIGDKVRVINKQSTHNTFDRFLEENDISNRLKNLYISGKSPNDNDEFTVFFVKKTNGSLYQECLIGNESNVYIVNNKGLKVLHDIVVIIDGKEEPLSLEEMDAVSKIFIK